MCPCPTCHPKHPPRPISLRGDRLCLEARSSSRVRNDARIFCPMANAGSGGQVHSNYWETTIKPSRSLKRNQVCVPLLNFGDRRIAVKIEREHGGSVGIVGGSAVPEPSSPPDASVTASIGSHNKRRLARAGVGECRIPRRLFTVVIADRLRLGWYTETRDGGSEHDRNRRPEDLPPDDRVGRAASRRPRMIRAPRSTVAESTRFASRSMWCREQTNPSRYPTGGSCRPGSPGR